jgi:hypothetical protein
LSRRAGAALLVAAAIAAVVPAGAAPARSASPAPSLRAAVAPAEVTVGDRVRVTLEVTLPAGERWGPPAIAPDLRHWGEAELLARGRPVALPEAHPGDPPRYRMELLLTAFRTGKVDLPPMPVAVAPLRQEEPSPPPPPLVFNTPPLSFTVRSVLPAQGEATPKPPTPPQPLPLGAAFWWTSGGLALACALAATLLLWRRRGLVAERPAAPALPPLALFLRELAALAGEPSPERVHVGLSLALRHLLASLLGFPAAERTTSEIDRELRRGPLTVPTRRRLLELLRLCDAVKFARHPATVAEARQRLLTAREVSEEVQRELVPEAPAAPTGEAAA